MPWFDLPLEQLREYRTETAEPPGFDSWWRYGSTGPGRKPARPPKLTRADARRGEVHRLARPDPGCAGHPAVRGYVERQLRHFRDLALGAIGALTAG